MKEGLIVGWGVWVADSGQVTYIHLRQKPSSKTIVKTGRRGVKSISRLSKLLVVPGAHVAKRGRPCYGEENPYHRGVIGSCDSFVFCMGGFSFLPCHCRLAPGYHLNIMTTLAPPPLVN